MPQPGVADEHSKSGQTKRISRRGQGAGAWCRTCCYWFCGSDGAVNVLDGSICKSGFWAIIERKIGLDFVCLCWPHREQARSHRVTRFMREQRDPLWERACSRWGHNGQHKFSGSQQKAHQKVGFVFSQRYQNNFNFGASSFNGSFFAVCSFQPPPRALYRLTWLTSCARRSVINACWALNS